MLTLASQSLNTLLKEEDLNAENLAPERAASVQMVNVEDESAKCPDAAILCRCRHDLPP